MRERNIEILRDTLEILEAGEYLFAGKNVSLKLSRREMEQALVYLPEDVRRIGPKANPDQLSGTGKCTCRCENTDSFTLARKRSAEFQSEESAGNPKPVLVLNLANPVHPGGGVRRGAKAQEEDLCRKSSLLLSLESGQAAPYYRYNRLLHTYMGSHAIMIHPQVEILKDDNGELLTETEIVSVMTCAAPMLRNGLEGLSQEQYECLMLERITGMLKVASHHGYRHLILGAFGCGAFQNDARVVSDLFCRAMKEFVFDGKTVDGLFRTVDFAVLDHSPEQYNYRQFARNFDHFHLDEGGQDDKAAQTEQANEKRLDRIRGCLIGGAAGDALGYPVEFYQEQVLFSLYGHPGISFYAKDGRTKKAQISDDTQMTLFTANGLLAWTTAVACEGDDRKPRAFVFRAYLDWLKTQLLSMEEAHEFERGTEEGGYSWLLDVPELYSSRAPGRTCMSSLIDGTEYEDYVAAKRNDRHGCGGVMRVAPMALLPGQTDLYALDMEGAQLAASTHGNSLGYMPAAILVHIIHRIVYPEAGTPDTLKGIVLEACEVANRLFEDDSHLSELNELVELAIRLSENEEDDLANIHKLGEGWTGEETLAISIYCALRHQDDFSAGIIAAVNHRGDSDSTGAVTGNILGALHGYSGIEERWKTDLELSDVILELAEDLYTGYPVIENGEPVDSKWDEKYRKMHRPRVTPPVLFYREFKENGCFSNWYRRKFTVDGVEYRHMEQFIMAEKARLFHDEERAERILRETEPGACKALGRQVEGFDDHAWKEVRMDVLRKGLRAKFEQNPDLLEKLLNTGDAVLAEASPKDRIYGIGLDAAEAAQTDPSAWPGQNLLGKALMEVRQALAGACAHPDN